MGYIGTQEEGQVFLPYETFEDEVIDPTSGIDLNEIEIVVAKHLLLATTSEPIRQKDLIAAVREERNVSLSERAVRVIIREFRRKRGFPICSRKGSPAGYWWGRTESEVEEFANVFLAQIKDEASTVAMMLRKNYPRLAGQMKLGLE